MALNAQRFGWTPEEMMAMPARFFHIAIKLVTAFENGIEDSAKHKGNVQAASRRYGSTLPRG